MWLCGPFTASFLKSNYFHRSRGRKDEMPSFRPVFSAGKRYSAVFLKKHYNQLLIFPLVCNKM